jgi:magnesium-transporting ATPase (P-type)
MPGEMPNCLSSSTSIRGLSETEAQSRLKAEGYNELPRPSRRTPLRIVVEVLREPMLALLLGGGAIYLVLGDLKEAVILLAFAMMSILITVVQETRTERVLEALRELTSPRATGHSRWRTQTNRRSRSGSGRFPRACGGRPDTSRRGARSMSRSADR